MLQVFLAFARLGCMSFGGPAAHLAYFRVEFVEKRAWLSEEQFAQCISITQLLPGPASSQTGMLIGLIRAGWKGAIAAWVGFTLPSAMLMTAFALYSPSGITRQPWVHGLLIVAVAVVAQAILTMRRVLITSAIQLLLAFGTCAALLAFPYPATAPLAVGLCAAAGLFLIRAQTRNTRALMLPVTRSNAAIAAGVFFALLVGLGFAAHVSHNPLLILASRLYEVGSLVFGGGHVVLPLLDMQVVHAGMASSQKMIAGYAAAQAMPGPLFTLGSYVGAMVYDGSLGIAGAIVATVAIFLPSFFLIGAVAPFYAELVRDERFNRALDGANASVVGLLAAAFVTPIWTNAVRTGVDGLFACVAFAALALLRWQPWVIVILGAAAGALVLR
jgi:chromate transporter